MILLTFQILKNEQCITCLGRGVTRQTTAATVSPISKRPAVFTNRNRRKRTRTMPSAYTRMLLLNKSCTVSTKSAFYHFRMDTLCLIFADLFFFTLDGKIFSPSEQKRAVIGISFHTRLPPGGGLVSSARWRPSVKRCSDSHSQKHRPIRCENGPCHVAHGTLVFIHLTYYLTKIAKYCTGL